MDRQRLDAYITREPPERVDEAEIEWEFRATVTGTVYATSKEGATQAARIALESRSVSFFADIEDVEPVYPDEDEQ